jgi:ankyrin repeat protein
MLLCTTGFGSNLCSQKSGGLWNQLTLLTKSTPLILACSRGSVDVVDFILSQDNVNLNAQNGIWKQHQCWLQGTRNGDDADIRLLAMTDIDVDSQSANGTVTTALMQASVNGHGAVVEARHETVPSTATFNHCDTLEVSAS